MPAREMVRLKPDTLEIAAAPSVAIDASTRQTPTLPTPETRPTPTTRPTLTTPSVPESSDEFIPLVPIAEQELTGSFQIVRVQMPRGSLGRLRSPLERPDELVEADVLLGADGMARAIRVSTASSIYARRSR